ncbi:hypothetical protein BKA70DRAFT_1427021 [Coprinopsis sp. MPI-PUGE-AT-0042]|nr:hypothetical protein BKA70DRAFT_1427021 [Coprinopsis sp. MPI-PUGE-AT-0042]
MTTQSRSPLLLAPPLATGFPMVGRQEGNDELYTDTKIHKLLDHANIFTFLDYFKDEDNIYITLELYPSGSLMDMLRRRGRIAEPETRLFMFQPIGDCSYMHARQVTH